MKIKKRCAHCHKISLVGLNAIRCKKCVIGFFWAKEINYGMGKR